MQSYAKTRVVDRASPCPPGKEVEESRAEGNEVRHVAQVFDEDHFASNAEHPVHFPKELYASFMTSKFVSAEDQECGIKRLVRGRKRSPVRRGQWRLG